MPPKRPRYFSMHDDDDFKVLRETSQSLKTMTQEEFHASLIDVGMITKSGRLTKPFRELYEQDMAIIEASNARADAEAAAAAAAQQGPGPSMPRKKTATAGRKPVALRGKTAAPRRKTAASRTQVSVPGRKTATSHRGPGVEGRKRKP